MSFQISPQNKRNTCGGDIIYAGKARLQTFWGGGVSYSLAKLRFASVALSDFLHGLHNSVSATQTKNTFERSLSRFPTGAFCVYFYKFTLKFAYM